MDKYIIPAICMDTGEFHLFSVSADSPRNAEVPCDRFTYHVGKAIKASEFLRLATAACGDGPADEVHR